MVYQKLLLKRPFIKLLQNYQLKQNLLKDFYNMKKQEIKKLSKDEIIKNIDKYKKDLFNIRFQKINSQVTNPSKIGQTKKTIARLKTLLKGKLNA
jgi:large subunit ribosomal protein L29